MEINIKEIQKGDKFDKIVIVNAAKFRKFTYRAVMFLDDYREDDPLLCNYIDEYGYFETGIIDTNAAHFYFTTELQALRKLKGLNKERGAKIQIEIMKTIKKEQDEKLPLQIVDCKNRKI
jgi:hypothetical protein